MRSISVLFAIIAGVFVVSLLAMSAGATMMGPGFMGPGWMGPGMMWGYGNAAANGVDGWRWGLGMALGWIGMVAFWAVIVVGAIVLVRWLGSGMRSTEGPSARDEPLEILRRRYAAGEIDDATYERMKRELAA